MDHPPFCRSCHRCLQKELVLDAASLPALADKRNLGATAEHSCVPCGKLKVCLPLHLSALAAFYPTKKKKKHKEQNKQAHSQMIFVVCFKCVVQSGGDPTLQQDYTPRCGKPLERTSASAALERAAAAYNVSLCARTQRGESRQMLSDAMSFSECACTSTCVLQRTNNLKSAGRVTCKRKCCTCAFHNI